MSGEDRPYFRFFPTAYELEGTFERSDTRCDACRKPAEWLYANSIYTSADPKPKLCARCIADGRASSVLEKDYQLHDTDLGEISPDLYTELMQRTPGFSTFNPFSWPTHEGVPLAFLGYGSDPKFWGDEKSRDAMRAFWRAETGEADLEGPTDYILVFRSLDGERYGFWQDLD